jgi:Glycosyltransferase family 87
MAPERSAAGPSVGDAARPERRADIAYGLGLGLGILFIVILGPLERRIELAHINDFSGLWSGARAIVLGIDPYETTGWRALVDSLGVHDSGALVNDYFPWVSLALLPFGFLSVEAAGWVWMLIGVTVAAVALRSLLRAYLPGRALEHGLFGLALLVTQPGFHALVLGQWAFLLLGAVAAGVLALRADRPVRAGVLSLAFLLKPQLFVFTALRFFMRRRVALVAIAAGAAVVAVSTALFPHWIAAWLSDVGPVRIVRSASVPVALSDVFGPAGATAGYALIVVGAFVATRFGTRSDASLAVWLALSSAGAIYSWSYDDLLLLVPIVITASVLVARRGVAPARAFAVGALGILFIVAPLLYALAVARHRESFSAVIPVLVFALIVTSLWPYRRTA